MSLDPFMIFHLLFISIAILAGSLAAVAGFGIGSLLTPVLAYQIGTKLAIAAISIPHFIGTALRCWLLRKNIDRKILLSFGITSALGGLTGALIHNLIKNPALTLIFGIILILSALVGLFKLNERFQFKGAIAFIAGAVSGGLGGLVGNQGGIRSAALLGFRLNKTAFVATATAIGLMVDIARMPVYFYSELNELIKIKYWILIATAGVLAGTCFGTAYLKHIQEQLFKRIVCIAILILGIWMLFQKQI